MLRPPHRLSTLPFLKAQVFSLRVLRRMLYSISANTGTLSILASSMKIHRSCSYFVYLALMSERFYFFTLAVWPSFLAKGMSPKEWSVKPPITLHIPFCEAKNTNSTPRVQPQTSSKNWRIHRRVCDLPAPGTPCKRPTVGSDRGCVSRSSSAFSAKQRSMTILSACLCSWDGIFLSGFAGSSAHNLASHRRAFVCVRPA